jgi:glutamate-1-semialdehyde-2,1-aminomutase
LAVRPDLQRIHDQVSQKAPTSAALHSVARELMPVVASPLLDGLHPIYVQSGAGSRLVDVDGNEYIDLTMGWGPHLLGHAPEVAVTALNDAAAHGMQFALHSPGKEPLARLVVDAFSANEMVLFCNSGTEATMHAIRLARAFTGKTTIAIFEGGYHGVHDYVLVKAVGDSRSDTPGFVPRSRGVPAQTLSTVRMLPYWSDLALDMIHDMRGELAAVLIEPVQGENPQTDQGPWLEKLREACTDAGVVLIFDELITGFRLGFGGGQELFGVPADIVTYGKVLGGGLPMGAIAGRREIMELFASRPGGAAVSSAGTFSGNPLSMATGAAVVGHLRAHPEVYSYLRKQSHRLATSLNVFFAANHLEARVQFADSILFLRLRPRPVMRTTSDAALDPGLAAAYDALQLKLLLRGVILAGSGGHQFYLSTAHSEQDVDEVIDAISKSLLEVRAEGYFSVS